VGYAAPAMDRFARGARRLLCRLALLGLAAATASMAPAGCGGTETPREPLHGIVLIGFDTLRADGLSSYGNPRSTSPRLDALAGEGVLFENAVSNASWTLPGFVSILSGEHPSKRVFRGGLLRSGVERLRDAGYRTAAFTEGGYVSRQFDLDRGFETFWEETTSVLHDPGPEVGVAKTFGRARDWLRAHAHEPFFLFVHTYEPHVPYQRLDLADGLDPGVLGGPYDRKQNGRVLSGELPVGEVERVWVRALYDGGVAAADRELGGLLAELKSLGVLDRTLVVATSDHGEQLGEHVPHQLGLHGQTLWDTVLHVPLVVRDPRREDAGRRIATQVRTVDIMPTILDLAGIPQRANPDGRSLVSVMDGAEGTDRPAFSELRERKNGRLRAATLRTGTHKLHLNVDASEREGLELYDLREDPGEEQNLARERPRLRARLHGELQDWIHEIGRRGEPSWGVRRTVGPELRRRLEALGYAQE